MSVHVLGIRHHGPGSARSLVTALEQYQPDAVLIEGPPDADHLIRLAAHTQMQPPVALLIYALDDTQQAAYYPFAVYSPEYQAILWALRHRAHVGFMDLPQTHQLAYRQRQTDAPTDNKPPEAEPTQAAQLQRDPLGWLGRAAGYDNGERWWEHIIEQRRHDLSGVFEAVLEAMTELRSTTGIVTDENEKRREAHMRQALRELQQTGYDRVAVVCGAWHSPALIEGGAFWQSATADAHTLTAMPSVAVRATWIPWTYGRMARESGYGAGVASPGWYHHLWATHENVVIRWLTKVAALLRERDLDASTAQIIDTARLVETLTAMRGHTLPGLDELNEAIQATMIAGASEPMKLIRRDLIVGERIGAVPPETPQVPLQHDLEQTRKRLDGNARKKHKTSDSDQIKYFKFHPEQTDLNLDLRASIDLERSHLLHRLRILGVPWGNPAKGVRRTQQGTFREDWVLCWQPEYEIKLIEQSIWGNTVQVAATAYVIHLAHHATDLPTLSRLLVDLFHADLPEATAILIDQLKAKTAQTSNVIALMETLPGLVSLRTGHHHNLSVRGVTLQDITALIDSLITRITIGLSNMSLSVDHKAAEELYQTLKAVSEAVLRLQNEAYNDKWFHTLVHIAESENTHGLLAGCASRLLLDAQVLSPDRIAHHMAMATDRGASSAGAAAWLDGFLRGSGLILLHDDLLFQLLDTWVMDLSETDFVAILPLLRRTFSSFDAPERRKIGEKARTHPESGINHPTPITTAPPNDIDTQRADRMLPILAALLGLESWKDNPHE
jgi:hypothetical protein